MLLQGLICYFHELTLPGASEAGVCVSETGNADLTLKTHVSAIKRSNVNPADE